MSGPKPSASDARSKHLPDGMSPEHWAQLQKLTEEQRHRVMERAALIFYGNPGTSWKDADERALREDVG